MNKHLSFDERIKIEEGLSKGYSLNRIARSLNRPSSTITREVYRNRVPFHPKNDYVICVNEHSCKVHDLCGKLKCRHSCSGCLSACHTDKCPEYVKFRCNRVLKSPFVCNGCEHHLKYSCYSEKFRYYAKNAQIKSDELLRSSREGISLSESEMKKMDELVSPLLIQGQSIDAIFTNHQSEIPCSRTTLYNYVNDCYLTARNIDMPRKVRFKVRYSHGKRPESFQTFVADRTYNDYKNYMLNNPDYSVWQMDTVIGSEGGKCLLTLLHEKSLFMLAYLLDKHNQECVINALNDLCETVGIKLFQQLFNVLLPDRGPEFGNPYAMECDRYGEIKTAVFYCDPYCSWQKGKLERNHEFIRYILPKGKSFDSLSQKDIHLMLIHINNYPRKSLNNSTPYELSKLLLGEEFIKKLHFHKLDPDRIILKPSLLQRKYGENDDMNRRNIQ